MSSDADRNRDVHRDDKRKPAATAMAVRQRPHGHLWLEITLNSNKFEKEVILGNPLVFLE